MLSAAPFRFEHLRCNTLSFRLSAGLVFVFEVLYLTSSCQNDAVRHDELGHHHLRPSVRTRVSDLLFVFDNLNVHQVYLSFPVRHGILLVFQHFHETSQDSLFERLHLETDSCASLHVLQFLTHFFTRARVWAGVSSVLLPT